VCVCVCVCGTDKYMCWLTQDALKMRAAEIVTFRSKQGSDVSEKIVVADDEVTSNAVIRRSTANITGELLALLLHIKKSMQ
jgi:hypothetical protein